MKISLHPATPPRSPAIPPYLTFTHCSHAHSYTLLANIHSVVQQFGFVVPPIAHPPHLTSLASPIVRLQPSYNESNRSPNSNTSHRLQKKKKNILVHTLPAHRQSSHQSRTLASFYRNCFLSVRRSALSPINQPNHHKHQWRSTSAHQRHSRRPSKVYRHLLQTRFAWPMRHGVVRTWSSPTSKSSSSSGSAAPSSRQQRPPRTPRTPHRKLFLLTHGQYLADIIPHLKTYQTR